MQKVERQEGRKAGRHNKYIPSRRKAGRQEGSTPQGEWGIGTPVGRVGYWYTSRGSEVLVHRRESGVLVHQQGEWGIGTLAGRVGYWYTSRESGVLVHQQGEWGIGTLAGRVRYWYTSRESGVLVH